MARETHRSIHTWLASIQFITSNSRDLKIWLSIAIESDQADNDRQSLSLLKDQRRSMNCSWDYSVRMIGCSSSKEYPSDFRQSDIGICHIDYKPQTR